MVRQLIENEEGLFKVEFDGDKVIPDKKIANFNYEVLEVRQNEEGIRYLVRFEDPKGIYEPLELLLDHEDLSNKHSFNKIVSTMAYHIDGSHADFTLFKNDLGYFKVINDLEGKIVEEIDYVGMTEDYFVGPNKVIDKEGNEIDNLRPSEEAVRHNDATIIDIVDEKEETILDIDFLTRFQTPENVVGLLGLVPIYMLKNRLDEMNINVPVLYIYGESGSGKTSVVKDIFLPLLGVNNPESMWLDFTSMKRPYSTYRKAPYRRMLPLVIDEFKPNSTTTVALNNTTSLIRNTYVRAKQERGNMKTKGGIDEFSLKAPIILIGETYIDEKAIIDRSMPLFFSGNPRKRGSSKEYRMIKNNKEDLLILGKRLLLHLMSKSDKEIRKELNEVIMSLPEIDDDRNLNNISLTVLGAKYIEDILGIDLDIDTFIREQTSRAKISGITQIDNTWNYIDYMFGEHEFSSKVFQVLPNERELRIHSDPLMKQFNKFMRINHPEVSEVILDKKQFDRTLKDKSYYKEARTVTIDGDNAYRRIIDVSKLIDELGEELIPNITNTVKGLEVKPTTKDGAMNSLIN